MVEIAAEEERLQIKIGIQRLADHAHAFHEEGVLLLAAFAGLEGTPGEDFRILRRGYGFHDFLELLFYLIVRLQKTF